MANSFLSRVDRSWRIGVPVIVLLFQVGAIVHARSVTARYFCWAPYDTQTAYTGSRDREQPQTLPQGSF